MSTKTRVTIKIVAGVLGPLIAGVLVYEYSHMRDSQVTSGPVVASNKTTDTGGDGERSFPAGSVTDQAKPSEAIRDSSTTRVVRDAVMETLTLEGHSSGGSVSFSPDGKRIVSGAADSTVKVWDAQTGQEMHTLKGHPGFVTSVSFSPDGKQIVSGSGIGPIIGPGQIKVWDADTGQEILTLKGHAKNVVSVSFSPDGKRIVSGSWDNTLKVWDVQNGQGTLTLEGHSGPVNSVSFSPDGKQVVSGSGDKTVKVWDISSLATSK